MSFGNVPPGSPPGTPPGGYGPPPGAPPAAAPGTWGAPPGPAAQAGGGAGGWGPPPGGGGGGAPGGGWGVPPGGAPGAPPPGFPPGQQPYGAPPGYGSPGPLATSGGSPLANPPEDIESGKTWAILSHASSFIGVPLWIIPLIQKDNAFALYHAKQALAIFVGLVPAIIVVTIISIVTCGVGSILFIAFLAFYYPIIMGLLNALNGKYEPVPWFGFIADKYFSGIVADKRPAGPAR